MAYKSGHIYLVNEEPTAGELAQFAKPVQFDICKNGKFYSIIYDKDGNRYVEETSKITTGFIKIGEITQNDDQINIGVHASGFNHWRINGNDITSVNPVNVFIEPVEIGKFRIDYIFGNTAGGIFVLPGTSGKFAIEPNILNYPDYAYLYRVLVTPDGFFVDDSTKVKTIGDITASSNSVTVGLHSSGKNTVIFNGVEKSTTEATPLPFTPVSTGKIKVLNIYALPTVQLFYLAQGAEGDEAVEPILPEGSLLIRRIIVTDEGPAIDPGTLEEFKEKDEDNWTRSVFTVGSTFNLHYAGKSQSFLIYKGLVTGVGSGTTKIGGIMFESASSRAIKFLIYNITGVSILIEASTTDGLKKGFSNNGTPYTLKSKKAIWVQYNPDTDLIDILDIGNSTPFEGVTTDPTLEGNGLNNLLRLSAAKNAEIAGKTTMTAVQSWVTSMSYATNADLTAGLANRYAITTTNITAPDATYKYVIITDASGVTRRLDLATYLSANLANKVDKLPGATKRLAQINEDGSLSAAAIGSSVPSKVIGKATDGSLTEYATTPFKVVSDLSTNPTLTDIATIIAATPNVDRIDFPNIMRIYYRVGSYWMYMILQNA